MKIYFETYHVSVSASQVISRHELLQMTIGVRDDEIISYDIAHSLPIGMTTAVVLTSSLGIASFLVYNYMVGLRYFKDTSITFYFIQLHPWSILINHQDDTTSSPEENTEYADINILVPCDPKIPGIRCN